MKLRSGVLILFLVIAGALFGQQLPSKALGKYAGQKPAYTAVKNEVEFSIDAQDVFVTFKEDIIIFTIGTLSLNGAYTALKIDGGNYSVKTSLSNDKNLKYDLEMLWSKKTGLLTIIGKNGEPDTVLEKLL